MEEQKNVRGAVSEWNSGEIACLVDTSSSRRNKDLSTAAASSNGRMQSDKPTSARLIIQRRLLNSE